VLADEALQRRHPFATPRTQVSGFYNCHGLVFAGRRAGIDDYSLIDRILREDCFEHVTLQDLLPGDIAIYYDNQSGEAIHSAVVVSVPTPDNPLEVITVISKWGTGREYLHKLSDCEYSATSRVEFRRIKT
jgi:hypothetical protein